MTYATRNNILTLWFQAKTCWQTYYLAQQFLVGEYHNCLSPEHKPKNILLREKLRGSIYCDYGWLCIHTIFSMF